MDWQLCKMQSMLEGMHIMSQPAIDAAIQQHPDAAAWLNAWWARASHARWASLHDVRADYPGADQVICCLVFNARGNRYRLICRVTYADTWSRGTLLVKHFLTHAEYNQEQWKKDCQ
jgi:mRNA interferase HigB